MTKKSNKIQAVKAAPKAAAPKVKATGNTNVVALVKAISDSIAPKDTNLGPNEKFPFGIRLTDSKGNISWERFKSAKERDSRMSEKIGGGITAKSAVNYQPPAAAPKPEAAAKQPAKKAAAASKAEPKPAADTFALHLNKTGRLCFGSEASKRMGAPEKVSPFIAMAITAGLVRLEPLAKHSEGALPVRMVGLNRGYISATKQFKTLGFDGSRSYDIEARPYGTAGFEFRLA